MVWQIILILGPIAIVARYVMIFYNHHFDNQNYLPYTILSYVVLLFDYNKTAEQFNIYQTIIAMGIQTHRNQNKFNKIRKCLRCPIKY